MEIIRARCHISPEVNVKGFKNCCMSNAMDRTDDMLWNSSEEDEDVKSDCKEDESTDCKNGVTQIGKGRYNLTCLVYYVHEIKSKIFFVSVCFISGG